MLDGGVGVACNGKSWHGKTERVWDVDGMCCSVVEAVGRVSL